MSDGWFKRTQQKVKLSKVKTRNQTNMLKISKAADVLTTQQKQVKTVILCIVYDVQCKRCDLTKYYWNDRNITFELDTEYDITLMNQTEYAAWFVRKHHAKTYNGRVESETYIFIQRRQRVVVLFQLEVCDQRSFIF